MYENYMFDGGSYKLQGFIELIEDVGGYIITRRIHAQDAKITFAIPTEDLIYVKECAKEIQGEIKDAPLLGTEIAVVTPTLSRHHLPHHLCDIAEYLRRQGAQTDMIGLARGVGRRVAQLNEREKRMIEEHDAAVICLGNFKRCIEDKVKIFTDLGVPLVITGLPKIQSPDFIYIEKLGRVPYKFKRTGEINLLGEVAAGVEKAIKRVREDISVNPPVVPPFIVKDEIINQVEDVSYGLAPGVLTLRTNGVRVKLPYKIYADDVANVEIAEYKLKEISTIKESANRGRILVDLLPESLVEV